MLLFKITVPINDAGRNPKEEGFLSMMQGGIPTKRAQGFHDHVGFAGRSFVCNINNGKS